MRGQLGRGKVPVLPLGARAAEAAGSAVGTAQPALHGPAPLWADVALIAAALALCGLAEPRIGQRAAGFAAVTVVVTTSLKTDADGKVARRRCILRLLGTAAGVAFAAAFGSSFLCMIVWAVAMVALQRKLQPSDGYACVVGALTYGVVALGDNRAAVWGTGVDRFVGVATGGAAVLLCLSLRGLYLQALQRRRDAKLVAQAAAA